MDDFRAIVKTFEMLGDSVKREQSQLACLNLARATINQNLATRFKDFVTDHLTPARINKAGTQLGRRQEVLQSSLERILEKASQNELGDDSATIPIDPRLLREETPRTEPVVSGFTAAPAPMGVSAGMSNPGGNNIFHSLKATTLSASGFTSLGDTQGPSQLEQVYAWGGEKAVRGLLELDDFEPTDKERQSANRAQRYQEKADADACRHISEQYGGVWTAPRWAGKRAPGDDRFDSER